MYITIITKVMMTS